MARRYFAPRHFAPKTICPKDILPQDILPKIAPNFGRMTYCPNSRILMDILFNYDMVLIMTSGMMMMMTIMPMHMVQMHIELMAMC